MALNWILIKHELLTGMNYCLVTIYKVISINRSPFSFYTKNSFIIYMIFILIILICSITIRLDSLINVLLMLPWWLVLIVRLLSGIYCLFSLFLLMNMIINTKIFVCNLKDLDLIVKILYPLFFLFIFIVNLYLLIINYNSLLKIHLANENFLIFYLLVITYGLIAGLSKEQNLKISNDLSTIGKVCIISWIIIFILARLGLTEYLTIYNDSTSDTNFQNKVITHSASSINISANCNSNIVTSINNSNVNNATAGSSVISESKNSGNTGVGRVVSNYIYPHFNLFEEVRAMRSNALTKWGENTFRNNELLKYYISPEFKTKVDQNMVTKLPLKLNQEFLFEFNLDLLNNKELWLLVNLSQIPEEEFSGYTSVVNLTDLKLREGNTPKFILNCNCEYPAGCIDKYRRNVENF
jgi:hypothetical protein